jgi:hypothetical protein
MCGPEISQIAEIFTKASANSVGILGYASIDFVVLFGLKLLDLRRG